MNSMQSFREKWAIEKPIYYKIGREVCKEISSAIKSAGIPSKTFFRVKETASLIKKIARKGLDYESIHDKVGVRIISSFKQHLTAIDSIILDQFKNEIYKREDMAAKLGENVFGYQSIHYDLCRKINHNEYFCEIQLRTICQDNWAELSHVLAYKSEIDIPLNIKREINALSAIFELADNQFQLIQDLISRLPETNPIKVLNYLETFFFSKIGDYYDRELSGYFLKNIDALYNGKNPKVLIQNFLTKYEMQVLKVVNDNKDNFFFTQPEIVLILERLQNSKYDLVNYWSSFYPIEELESVANSWGMSIE